MSDWFERFGFAEVGDGLLVGAYPLDAEDVAKIANGGADVVYNLVEDDEYGEGVRETLAAELEAAGVHERRLPLVDYGRLGREELDRAVAEVLEDLQAGRRACWRCARTWGSRRRWACCARASRPRSRCTTSGWTSSPGGS